MASKLRARTRRKPTHAKAKAAQRAGNAKRAKKAKKAQIDKRADENRENYRSKANKGNANIKTGGISTGREAGIMASHKANKIKGLEQSVGSLDRRIQNALNKGDTDTAKDLRSRLNKFTTDLGYARAIKGNGVARSSSGNILKTSSGNPIMTSSGRTIFDETKDQDFSDPTRKLQNTGGDAYGKMYPISNYMQRGPAMVQGLKSLFDKGKKRDIPYNLEDMPGVRYPLDKSFGAGVQEPFGGRSRDPNYKQPYFSAPLEDISISDMVISDEADDQEGNYDPVPYIHPAIDPNKRSEIMEEGYGDIIDSGRQDYDTLFKEWEKNNLNQSNLLDTHGDPIDPVKLQELLAAAEAEKKAFAEERQNKFYNKDGIEVGGEGNLLNVGKELYNLGGYLSGGQLLNKYALEPAADALLGENQMVPIDQSEFSPENIDYSQIIETLKGPGYNLKEDMIQELLNYKPDLLNDGNLNSTLSDFYSQ